MDGWTSELLRLSDASTKINPLTIPRTFPVEDPSRLSIQIAVLSIFCGTELSELHNAIEVG